MTTDELVKKLGEFAEAKDFAGAWRLVRANRADLEAATNAMPMALRDALKKTSDDRLVLSFLDGVGFGTEKIGVTLNRLEKLLSYTPGARVLNDTWGLGEVKRVDGFYRRITVDFKTKKGHQFTYAAATDLIVLAPDDHVLVIQKADPKRIEDLLKDKPGDFVKLVLASYGNRLTLVKLEDIIVGFGFVKQVNWKAFWDRARTALKADKLVQIPARKADPIELLQAAESYGGKWASVFAQETDPKLILASVKEFVAQLKEQTVADEKGNARTKAFLDVDEETRDVIGNRLAFAVTAARNVDDALYARLACMVVSLGYATPAASTMRAYLWERKRYIKAAAALPVRDVGAMIEFLADSADSKAKLYAALPDFCFAAVCEIVSRFGGETLVDAEGKPVKDELGRVIYPCRQAVGALMKSAQAPATLTTLVVGKYEMFSSWTELPPLVTLLSHAIALGEGRQSGETLKMQNIVRRLFADVKWLAKVFAWLATPDAKACFFERFQASIAWDPSTHHTIVVRMVHLEPSLESHVVKVEKKREYARLTSPRSFAEKKAAYLKVINVEMPENIRKIEFAKGFGDLSENAEYQYAKDEQRQLMQKQTLMQADLEAVKSCMFEGVATDEVAPGVTVIVSMPDGEKTYSILGEWDNDLELGILSFKTALAANLLGKRAGDQFRVPNTDPAQFGKVVRIEPLSETIRAWMQVPAGLQV